MIAVPGPRLNRKDGRRLLTALPFVGPWVFGFVVFTAYPIYYSFTISFTRYAGLGDPTPIGFENYRHLYTDALFWKSIYNTLYYVALAVPVGLVIAIALGLAMNQNIREVAIYRAALYAPSILPIYALTFVVIVLLNPRFGLLDYVIVALGGKAINWLGDPAWTKISLVILAQFAAGAPALIFLAAIRGIPKELFESAALDGAGAIRRFIHVTLPLLTPVILYDLILGLILGLQIFTPAFLLSQTGAVVGPSNSLMFYVVYLYKTAFEFADMGYASALATVLFAISVVLALAIWRTSRAWVHYEVT